MFGMKKRTRQYFCMNYIDDNACMHELLQNSTRFSNFCKTQHVLYTLNADCGGFKCIKYDIPVCHEDHEDISTYQHFSAFLLIFFISLHISAFLFAILIFGISPMPGGHVKLRSCILHAQNAQKLSHIISIDTLASMHW